MRSRIKFSNNYRGTQIIFSRRELASYYRITGFTDQLYTRMLMGNYITYSMKLHLLKFSKSQRAYSVKSWFQGFLQSLGRTCISWNYFIYSNHNWKWQLTDFPLEFSDSVTLVLFKLFYYPLLIITCYGNCLQMTNILDIECTVTSLPTKWTSSCWLKQNCVL